jgi:hypothetical protein
MQSFDHAEVLVEGHAAVAVDVGLAHQHLRRPAARHRVPHAGKHVPVHAPPQVRRRDEALPALVHGHEVVARVLRVEREEDGVEHARHERQLRQPAADGRGLLDGVSVVRRGEAREAVLVDVGEAHRLEQALGVGDEHLVLHGDLEEVEQVDRREQAVLADQRGEEVVVELAFNLLEGVAFSEADLVETELACRARVALAVDRVYSQASKR